MSIFKERLLACGISGLDMRCAERMEVYYKLLLEWNARMNLTAVTDEAEAVEKHFIDSLALIAIKAPPKGARLLDVGTGAGFPGMAPKILRPDIRACLMDSTNKKLLFLGAVAQALGLEAVELKHARAEEAARDPKYRQRFDVVCARAVARLSTLCEYALPFVRVGGYFAAYKGTAAVDEMLGAQKAVWLLGGGNARAFKSPHLTQAYDHHIILIDKLKDTPYEYPRASGKARSKPL